MTKYVRPADADERIEGAILVIEALLPLRIQDRMKRKFLSNCLWQITQAEGRTKYEIRYRSKASLEAPKRALRHEHVTTRKVMVEQLLANPKKAREIAEEAIGCVVTHDEHLLLSAVSKSLDGWARYQDAGILVVDMVKGKRVRF
jgi:hypothetical protein